MRWNCTCRAFPGMVSFESFVSLGIVLIQSVASGAASLLYAKIVLINEVLPLLSGKSITIVLFGETTTSQFW